MQSDDRAKPTLMPAKQQQPSWPGVYNPIDTSVIILHEAACLLVCPCQPYIGTLVPQFKIQPRGAHRANHHAAMCQPSTASLPLTTIEYIDRHSFNVIRSSSSESADRKSDITRNKPFQKGQPER